MTKRRERSRAVLRAAESVLAVSRAAIGLELSPVAASRPVLQLAPAPQSKKAAGAALLPEHRGDAARSACTSERIE